MHEPALDEKLDDPTYDSLDEYEELLDHAIKRAAAIGREAFPEWMRDMESRRGDICRLMMTVDGLQSVCATLATLLDDVPFKPDRVILRSFEMRHELGSTRYFWIGHLQRRSRRR